MGVAHALQTIANSIRQMLGQIHAVMKQTEDIDGLTDSHLLATQGAPQREHLADEGDQHHLHTYRSCAGCLGGTSWADSA